MTTVRLDTKRSLDYTSPAARLAYAVSSLACLDAMETLVEIREALLANSPSLAKEVVAGAAITAAAYEGFGAVKLIRAALKSNPS